MRDDTLLPPKIINVEPLHAYRLKLHYENGEIKLFDVSPYIQGDWYGALQDLSYFKTVRSLPDGSGIEWAGGQDIAPHELYDLSIKLS